MSFRLGLTTLPVMALLLACGRNAAGNHRSGELTVEWLGADTGGLSTRPHAIWCERDGRFKLTATKGDIGVGIVIYPKGLLRPGPVSVFDPGLDSVVRPGVAIAGRWVGDKAVAAFQSDSGSLELTQGATGLGGTFGVRLRGLNSTDTVRMTGHFGGVTPEACPNDSTPSGPPQ
jgi:hypothetical protein